jgi:hypothetical protein
MSNPRIARPPPTSAPRAPSGGAAAPPEVPLAVKIALDLAVAYLARVRGAALVIAADPARAAAGALWIEDAVPARRAAEAAESAAGATRVLWLTPEADDAGALARLVPTGGRVAALSAGPAEGFLARLRGRSALGRSEGRAVGALARSGFEVELRCGVGGLSSALWALLGRAAERGGRDDLADRFALAYRRSLAAGARRGPAEILVVGARRR